MVAKYPTHDDKKAFWRLPTLYKSVQEKNKDIGQQFPLIMSSGRLVEYEGGGEETRSNPWLAELQQEMFIEINPVAANDRGIRDGEKVWVKTPTGAKILVRALVTERVDRATVWMPYHFSGRWQGTDLLQYYPEGALDDQSNAYGYNVAILMTQTLKQCGNDLSRENIMKQAANIKNFDLPLLLPGIKINTSPTDFAPIEQEQLAKFDGEKWAIFGEMVDAVRK
jgi:predicted molibdopterin-dependent oxidoreductase YjgC